MFFEGKCEICVKALRREEDETCADFMFGNAG